MNAKIGTPKDQHRRHNEVAGSVAHPPIDPSRIELFPACEAAERQAGGADCRAEHGAGHRGEDGKLQDVLRRLEGSAAARVALHQITANHRFQRVPGRDDHRCRNGTGGGVVGEECADEYSRPGANTEQQQTSQRDTRGRPNRRGVGVNKRQTQTEFRRREVHPASTMAIAALFANRKRVMSIRQARSL